MWVALMLGAAVAGCVRQAEQEVVVYTALDREFSEPVFAEFASASGVQVLPKYDQESNKTVGLVNILIEQQQQPRCDLFWNNEILHTLRLQRLGLLEPLECECAEDYPPQFRGSDGTWFGFAARARVLIVNKSLLVDRDQWPRSVLELADPKWSGNCGMARPLFGTTASHAAVLYSRWGESRANDFFRSVSRNAVIEGGNKQVAQNVAAGRYAWGITDTDDAIIELESGKPVAIVMPDQGAADMGCLQIPNTLARIKGGPNPAAAQQLVTYLLGAGVEDRLARGPSAQIPLGRNSSATSRAVELASWPAVEGENADGADRSNDIRWAEVDFEAAAEAWESSREKLEALFPTGG